MASTQVLGEVSTNIRERTVTLRELLNSNALCQPGRPVFVNAWVVGSESSWPHPRMFTYRACNFQMRHGLCRRSLELGDKCGHGVDLSDCIHVFRAQLLICDCSGPMWVTIFDALASLLGMPASSFQLLPPSTQIATLRDRVQIPSQEFNRQPVNVPCKPPQQRWTNEEIQPLIEAKRIEAEKEAIFGKRDKMVTAKMKWAMISEELKTQGVNRSGKILKKKWDRMMEFFKKVYDWQQRTPSGQIGFFQMPSHERRERNLPATFLESWYDTMGLFCEKSKVVNPGRDRVVDASDADFPTATEEEEETIPIGSCQGSAPPPSLVSFEGHQEHPTPDTQQISPTRSQSTNFENMGRRKKKGRTGAAAEASNGVRELCETIASETRRHNEHEDAMMLLEKLKHQETMHIHNRALLLEESHSLRICGVLSEVGVAVRELTQELSKNRG